MKTDFEEGTIKAANTPKEWTTGLPGEAQKRTFFSVFAFAHLAMSTL